ncbi:MAG: acyl-CoA dehydrogenase C-terminal domain-containing protein [Acidimicrobiia bacterium]
MTVYSPPLKDLRFVLHHLIGLEALAALPGYEHVEADFVDAVLEEAGKFLTDVWFPLNRSGDVEGSHLRDGVVVTPKGFKEAFHRMVEGGWLGIPFPEQYGGGHMPATIVTAIGEMINATNTSLAMAPGLTQGAVDALLEHGSEEMKETYVRRLIAGEWAGTMCLTEPQAGSDVGALTTKATPADDGTWRVKGTKIFISWGDHDLTENIIHLVLARTPDSPPGTKGISLFVVPKYLVNEDGSLGACNDIQTVSLEHKMGIKASPTAVLSFGDQGEGSIGYLVGEERQGMRYMFTMMNNARVAVGLAGVSIAEIAYQNALAYAQERVQGRPIGTSPEEVTPIIGHANVRRMLMTMKAQVEAMRALLLENAYAMDMARSHPDDETRYRYSLYADLLTPVSKAWATDLGNEVASMAIQVYGGMGYIEESGMPQFYRDARILSIYEGTNGIQALDLIGRKLPAGGGAAIMGFIGNMKAIDADLAKAGERFGSMRTLLADGVTALEQATGWLAMNGMQDPNQAAAGATQYLNMLGTVAGGFFLAKSALAASRLLEAGNADREFLEAKIATARFYAEQLLPLGTALLGPVTAGKENLFAIDPDQMRH